MNKTVSIAVRMDVAQLIPTKTFFIGAAITMKTIFI
jgi:hypothetical protein